MAESWCGEGELRIEWRDSAAEDRVARLLPLVVARMADDYAPRMARAMRSRAARSIRSTVREQPISAVLAQLEKGRLNCHGEELELRERLLRYGIKLADPDSDVPWFPGYDDNPDAEPADRPLACRGLWGLGRPRRRRARSVADPSDLGCVSGTDSAADPSAESEAADRGRRAMSEGWQAFGPFAASTPAATLGGEERLVEPDERPAPRAIARQLLAVGLAKRPARAPTTEHGAGRRRPTGNDHTLRPPQ